MGGGPHELEHRHELVGDKRGQEGRRLGRLAVPRAAERAEQGKVQLVAVPLGRGGRHELRGDEAEHGDPDDDRGGDFDRDPPGQNRAEEDGEIGARLDQPGPGEHFVGMQVLGQDRVLDRPEECRVDAHCEQRGKQ